ncbi:carboxypeptidase-like regulatory domain-containing protein [Chitinophaga sp. 30R24]|uniref:carboxypeptidase-like regulatory domain-containing protein n=1 Tax=Chitinophaga sp. 30R24 TaxID=3248838 RepID=UPI003B914755
MKKSIVGMLALAATVVSMSAFKSADLATVRSFDSTAMVNVMSHVDSLRGTYAVDSLKGLDSLQVLVLDSLQGPDSLQHLDSLQVLEAGSITGKITPADGATEVEVANGDDKLKGAIAEGTFTVPVAKAGAYTITILGKSPYKNAVIKDVKVEEGKATDLGEIKLEQ